MLSTKTIKRLKSLALKKYRLEWGEFIVEGQRLVWEAVAAGQTLRQIYLTKTFQSSQKHSVPLKALEQAGPVTVLTESEMKRISQTRTPPGILAVCPLPPVADPDKHLITTNWLYLDKIGDPGNLGTLLRTAVWFGLKAIALSPGCSDPFNPKTVRSGMGAHFHLDFLGPYNLESFRSSHFLLGADHRGEPFDRTPKPASPWLLAVGSEAHGLAFKTRSVLHQTLAIPRIGQGESLNVGVATGILLHYLTN